jgi:HK97 family phage portal protein
MTWFDRLLGREDIAPDSAAPHGADVQAYSVIDLAGDLAALGFMRELNSTGAVVNRRTVLKNASVARCVFLISNAIGMLPLQLLRAGDANGAVEKAKDHPLYDVLAVKPNGWQTAFEFRRLMQHRALTEGNGYALPIKARDRVTALIPLATSMVTVEQKDDWSVIYKVRGKTGKETIYDSRDMFHLRGPSDDGIKGLALTEFAAETLGLSLRAQEAAGRIFKQGFSAGTALESDKTLGPEAIENLKASLQEKFSGSENAGKTIVLEEGLKIKMLGATAKESQNIETRQHQIEEIARIFGVPRPFLMVDDTSWGSGIEQLGIFFVQYGLAPWFVAWEQAISRTLLTDQERKTLYPKFNERALLRGSMKDQGEFFAKMMGSGGSPQIMEQNEARGLLDLPEHPDGFGLSSAAAQAPATGGTNAQQ